MGNSEKTFSDEFENYMKGFLFRLLRHEFVVSYIDDFFNQTEKSYYTFFILMKVLGSHDKLQFQSNYWSDCYVYFYEKLGIHGILFIPLLLSKGSTEKKNNIIKKYLNEHINNTKERLNKNSNLVMNLIDFKKVILTYISCISTRALENVIKVIDKIILETKREEVGTLKILFSNKNIENFVDILLRPYSRQNFYVNAGKFIDDNIDFLTNDKTIRKRLKQFALKQIDTNKKIKELHQKNLAIQGGNIQASLRDKPRSRLSGTMTKKTDIEENSVTNNNNNKDSNQKLNIDKKNVVENSKSKEGSSMISFKSNEWAIKKENTLKKIQSRNGSITNDSKSKKVNSKEDSDGSYGLSKYDFNEEVGIENKPRNFKDDN